jgi:hypothetical protein
MSDDRQLIHIGHGGHSRYEQWLMPKEALANDGTMTMLPWTSLCEVGKTKSMLV